MNNADVEQRVMSVLDGGSAFPVPICDSYWPEFVKAWRSERAIVDDDVDIHAYYNIDIRIARLEDAPWVDNIQVIEQGKNETVLRDGWGRVVRQKSDCQLAEVISVAISDTSDLKLIDNIPLSDSRLDTWHKEVAEFKSHHCVFGKVGGPFLRSAYLRGEEQWLMDMVTDTEFAADLAARVAEYETKLGLMELKKGGLQSTGIWIFDDMASNKGMLFSPKIFEDIFLPCYKNMVSAFKEAGAKKVILHSDGNVEDILDMLIQAGIDGINPVEPRSGMHLPSLKSKYGGKLCFIGGLCNSLVLPGGDRDEIRAHVFELLEAASRGGVALGNHSVGPDISVDTYEYVLDLMRGGRA